MSTFTQRLIRETQEAHLEIHKNPLMRAIASGTVQRHGYIAQLQQLLAVHITLETGAGASSDLTAVVNEDQIRSPLLRDDLSYLIIPYSCINPPPLKSTTSFVDYFRHVARTEPSSLLGAFCVVEGGLWGGGPALLDQLRKTLNLDGDGVRYMSSGTIDGRKPFESFKDRMNLIIDKSLQDASITVASNTFMGLDTIYKEIAARLR